MKKLTTFLMLLLATTVRSQQAFSQAVTITLNPGWTWISYSRADTLDFATALGTFTPMEGDIIKSQYGFALYQEGQWSGGIQQFYPGLGYMYYSMRTVPTPISFGEPAPQVIVTTMEPTDISNTSANCGGSITSNDGSYIYVLEKGICWATHPNPTAMNDFHTESGGGSDSFMASMNGLIPNTLYYIRAYAVSASGTTYGEEWTFTTLEIPAGAIDGLFSVSDSKQVYFSQGNLQYIGSTSTPHWRFADNQWDYLGTTTGQNSSSQDVDRDLFGWGTSGWDNGNAYYLPWHTDFSNGGTSGSLFGPPGPGMYDLTGSYANADWGVYNLISNGGNQVGQWRSLTKDERVYVFNTRMTTSGIRYAKGNVNNVNGIILLPDDWNTSYYVLNNANDEEANFSSNTITAIQWNNLEQQGAVFLPAAGSRMGTSVREIENYGGYWSVSYYNSSGAYTAIFGNSSFNPQYSSNRSLGRSVRLVHDYQP